MIVGERIALGELTDVVTKGTTPTSLKKDFVSDGIPFLRINNLDNGLIDYSKILYIDDDTNKLLKRSVIKSGDFLLTIAGTIGKTAIVPDDAPLMNCNQAIAILRVKKELDKDYLKCWLNTPDAQSQIAGAKVTATISNLSLGQIKEFKIPLPPIKEQKRIAAILDKADAIRRKRQQAIDLTDQLLRSVFLDMFGDPVTNPKGLKTAKISEIGEIITGNSPSRAKPEYYGDHIEWIKSGNINTPSHYLTKAEEFLSQEGLLVGRSVPENSLLVTCIAGSKDCIGNVAIANRTVSFNQQINAIVPNGNVLTLFLYAQLAFNKMLVQRASTESMKGMVSKSKFSEIEILLPLIPDQEKYVKFFSKTLSKIKAMESSSDHSVTLFNSLTQQAFNGELSKQIQAA